MKENCEHNRTRVESIHDSSYGMIVNVICTHCQKIVGEKRFVPRRCILMAIQRAVFPNAFIFSSFKNIEIK